MTKAQERQLENLRFEVEKMELELKIEKLRFQIGRVRAVNEREVIRNATPAPIETTVPPEEDDITDAPAERFELENKTPSVLSVEIPERIENPVEEDIPQLQRDVDAIYGELRRIEEDLKQSTSRMFELDGALKQTKKKSSRVSLKERRQAELNLNLELQETIKMLRAEISTRNRQIGKARAL